MMTEFEKMTQGVEFDGRDPEIAQQRQQSQYLLRELNQRVDTNGRTRLLMKLLGSLEPSSTILSPFYCDFGRFITIGRHCCINQNVIMLDGGTITIGDHVLVGSNVQFLTPSPPVNTLERRKCRVRCLPIVVEDDVWIGAGSIINQGVTIGRRSVISAHAFVNKDVPPNSLYGGIPARYIALLT